MFNIIWIPIYAQAGINQGHWIYGDTFDIYPNNAQYYGLNIWSGYNADTTGNGGNFTSIIGTPYSSFSGYGNTTGMVYRQYELFGDSFDIYQTGNLILSISKSSLQDYGTLGSSWTKTINADFVSSGYIGSGGYLNGGCFKCNHDSAYLLNDFTIEFWAKRLSDSWGATYGRFIEKNYLNGFTMNRDASSNRMNLSIMGDQDAYNNAIPLNEWTHFAAVRSGSTAFLYISGILDKQAATSSLQLSNTGPLEIGSDIAEIATQIIMDEVRLWSYARSSGEINSNMGISISPYQSGLLNYIRFETTESYSGFALTGGYWVDHSQSGSLQFLKNIYGYVVPNSVLQSDTFDMYNTGDNYTGTFSSLGYRLNGFVSGSTGNFYITKHDTFFFDNFDPYQDGLINSLASGILISGYLETIRTGVLI
jgi:hypothetical protein